MPSANLSAIAVTFHKYLGGQKTFIFRLKPLVGRFVRPLLAFYGSFDRDDHGALAIQVCLDTIEPRLAVRFAHLIPA